MTWIEQMQLASNMHQVKLKWKVFKPEWIVHVAKTIRAASPTVLEQIPAVEIFLSLKNHGEAYSAGLVGYFSNLSKNFKDVRQDIISKIFTQFMQTVWRVLR